MTKTGKRLLAIIAVGGAFGLGMEANALAGQPHMQMALDHLQAARAELVEASADKGGHRAAAIQLVDRAIAQTQMGIGWDRRH